MGKIEQQHLYREYKASQETLPGCNYVYQAKPTVQGLLSFVMGEIDNEQLKQGVDIVIGIDSEVPIWVMDKFLDRIKNTKFSKKLSVSDDGKII